MPSIPVPPPNLTAAQSAATAFLDSSFSSTSHPHLSDLLPNARQRHEQLQANLSLSNEQVEFLLSDTLAKAEAFRQSAQELSLLRHSLADELTELSQELASNLSVDGSKPTLLEDIETMHRNLKELTSIRSYVQIIEHALSMSESAVENIRSSTSSLNVASIGFFRRLQEFVSKIRDAWSTCDNGATQQQLHLISFLTNLEIKTWAEMKTVLSDVLLSHADKLGWPMPVNLATVTTDNRAAFECAFKNLLKLQSLGEESHPIRPPSTEKDGLYAFQALVQPIALRFKYHFEGSRQTNRLDKPEWYFTHVQNLAHDHRLFMEEFIQNLLLSTEYKKRDAWREFVYLLLPMLTRKLRHSIPSILPHSALLAHTIYQALIFDASLREEGFNLQGIGKEGGGGDVWLGIGDVIIGNHEWFEAWLVGERKFTEDQYHSIISSPDAWAIVDDDNGTNELSRDLKPTTSSRRIKALLEQITDRYSPLPRSAQRMKFLVTVQLPILDVYHSRIASSLEAFEMLSSAFLRAVPGALSVSFGGKEESGVNLDTHRLTGGVEGVQRLCKAFLSATFMEVTLKGWAEELFFLELWTEINGTCPMREEAMACPLLPRTTVDRTDAPTTTIFDEVISRYAKIITRAEDMIIQQVCGEVENSFKAHLNTIDSIEQDTDDVALSQSLLTPVALLSSHLTSIRSILSQTAVTMLYRRIASNLAEHILHRQILYRGRFNLTLGKALAAECELWVETCHAALAGKLSGGRYRVEAPWLKLVQAGRLVSLEGEAWDVVRKATIGSTPDEEWSQLMKQVVAVSELDREVVIQILRRREDY
ncbi:hypothetical protein AMATHDRAFT_134611 [Amanita thiersii Skay4041]|uniref:RINT-1 family protein n=1 Tax=Amanita thiersii Skay4041 TaxID=703135 RepID=A0A2A9NW19_9AGAR|nr:hypothetical protein AMATHDRAFT_134611 [Amanita thiersii Skay4041]